MGTSTDLENSGVGVSFTGLMTSSATAGVSSQEGKTITFTVTPSTKVVSDTVFNLNVTGQALGAITATTSAADFSAASPIIFAAGDTAAQTVTVTVVSDSVVEGIEAYKAQLLDSGFNLVGTAITGTINDATPTITLAASATTVNEGASVVYTATSDMAAPAGGITIPFTLGGTATAADYTTSATSITIAAGATTGSLTLNAIADNATEGAETVTVALSTANGATVSTAPVSVTINDTSLALTANAFALTGATAVNEGSSATYTVTRGAAATVATTVTYAITGTATNGTDYTAQTGTLSFAIGETVKTITVPVTADTTTEGSETMIVTLGTITPNTDFVATGLGAITTTIADTSVGAASVPGTTFTLTNGADTLDTNSATAAYKTTVGDDTFRAPTDGYLTTADYIDAGTGNDVLTAAVTSAGQTVAPVLKNLEDITVTVTAVDAQKFTFNAADVTGATVVAIKGAGAVSSSAQSASSDEVITVSNLAKTTSLGIIGGTASSGATSSDIVATFTGVLAADTQKVAISTLGKVGTLTLATAETVEITATGTGTTGANTIGSLLATAVKTLNIKGSGDLTIAASDLAATVTVNASTATGTIAFTGEVNTSTTFTGGTGATTVTTASTGVVSVTTFAGADTVNVSGGNSSSAINTGAGNDRVLVGAASNVTAADVINGGADTDTIAVSDATINATTKTALALGISAFEQLETTATAEVSIDYNALSTYSTVTVSGASGASAAGAANTAGSASIAATMENDDALIVSAARTGQAGGVSTVGGTDTAGAGGNGITLTPKLDAGANVAALKLIGNADVTGGAGGASVEAADTGGAGGAGLSASTLETLNLEIAGTNATGVAADTVTFAGGAGGAAGGGTAGAAGSSVVIGANGTINITDSLLSLSGTTAAVYNNLDLGTVVGTNATINASTFHGKLTVTAASGNVAITGGSAADTLTGGAGQDNISGGAGADSITAGDGADILSGGLGRDVFVIATEAHSDTLAYDVISGFGKVTETASVAQVGAMTNNATFIATATAAGGAEADYLDLVGTAALAAAATGTDVSGSVTGGSGTCTASISAKGVITLAGTNTASVDTLVEWTTIAHTMLGSQFKVGVFEFGGSTYLQERGSGVLTTDDLVQLTGVTGVTGLVALGGAVAAVAGDIFVL